MKTSIVIPSRLASSRLPQKALADIFGVSMIMRVYSQALKSTMADEVIIATDHEAIYDHAKYHGANVTMTSMAHQSGTDRVAEVANELKSDIIVNLQGDEPIIDPGQIDDLIKLMHNPDVLIGTQCKKINNQDLIFDYNVVKVVRDINYKVLYFSRQAIPAIRDAGYADWHHITDYFRHIGIYGFKRNTLLELTTISPSSYETSEALEQLRWLQNGYSVYCSETMFNSMGVDTEEDLQKVRDHVFKEMNH
ncbi:MAG: 3-deoxy-manno-octulosonate cytidylyltransferase [Saprospiraceae bacterium]|nr:3-deoxy-manno-octulosonate cytidylyltransferase [Saprospiraceae bacterium]